MTCWSCFPLPRLFPQTESCAIRGWVGLHRAQRPHSSFCKDSLSHAEGLKLVARTCSRLNTSLPRKRQLGSCHKAHLEVEAGETDCVILLLFAFSLLKRQQSKKIWLTPHTNVCAEMWAITDWYNNRFLTFDGYLYWFFFKTDDKYRQK